jgi:glycosyltransferase involved in cell wall biosynthesis
MKITIVVRTYNRPELLKECLSSIALQTYSNWELILFDDAGSDENFSIYKTFKSNFTDKRCLYITSQSNYEMFKNSWLLAPDLSQGEVIVRLDDDDLLTSDCLEFLWMVYSQNPELDFAYGSCARFNNDGLIDLIQTKNPLEVEKTTMAWEPYTIPNNHPWQHPWRFVENYYNEPQNWTSIIHCSKSNILCIMHPYSMRVSSVKKVKDKIQMTSKYIDDLEFFGSLDYLGLGHNAFKKVLCFVREHQLGRITDNGKIVDGTDIWQENFRIRDKVDHLRNSGFISKIIPINNSYNTNNGIDNELIKNFDELNENIKKFFRKSKLKKKILDWRAFS